MKQAKKKDVSRLLDILAELGPVSDVSTPVDFKDAILTHREQTEGLGKRERGPCGKVKFSSESSTKAAIRRRLERSSNASRLRAYFCEQCHAWHMSSAFRKF